MKVVSSIKTLKNRHPDCKVVRRRGRLYVICKTHPRFKARQGWSRLFADHFKPFGEDICEEGHTSSIEFGLLSRRLNRQKILYPLDDEFRQDRKPGRGRLFSGRSWRHYGLSSCLYRWVALCRYRWSRRKISVEVFPSSSRVTVPLDSWCRQTVLFLPNLLLTKV